MEERYLVGRMAGQQKVLTEGDEGVMKLPKFNNNNNISNSNMIDNNKQKNTINNISDNPSSSLLLT